MLKEKETQLKDRLKLIIREIGHKKDIKQDIFDEFKSRNLNAHRAILAFSENLDLYTLTDSEDDIRFLFLFAFALNSALERTEEVKHLCFDIRDYFTKVEYSQWIEYREEKSSDDIFPIIIENVDEISENYWQAKVSAQTIEKWNSANILLYNPNTQRGLKVTKKAIRINVNSNKVKEISERMLDGKQFPDDLKFNVLGDKPIYNPQKRTLIIDKESIINTFDGQHRKEANALALSVNPNLNFNWPIKITAFSEIKAHDFMTQINKQTPINEEYLSTKDYTKDENLIVDKIMDSKGELADVAKDSDDFVKENRGLTTKSILAEAIKDNYKDQIGLSYKNDNVAKWIVEFTNYLMGYYVDEFIVKPYEVKKDSYINNMYMFYGYIALSAKLQNDSNWQEVLKQKIESINFNKHNELWKSIGIIEENKINKTTKNKLYNLFFEEV